MFISESKVLAPAIWAGALAYLLLGVATVCFGIDLYMVVHTASAVPVVDHWMFLMPLARNGSYSFRDLWAQHNEHRLVIPKLFYLADFYWFRGRNVSLFASIMVVQALHALLLMRIADVSRALQPALFALLFAFLFSPVQLHNFVWAFQICFVLGAFFASACAWSFGVFYTRYQSKMPLGSVVRAFALTVALALCATLSLANGLVLWPILAVILIALRVDWRYAVALLAITGLVFTAYFWGWFTPDGHSDPLESLQHPVEMVHYVLCYLGGSWAIFGIGPAFALGGVGAAIGVIALVKMWTARQSLRTLDIFIAVTILGSIGTAFETALGRLDFGLGQAASSRYQTVALVYWAALAMWVVSTFRQSPRRMSLKCWAVACFSLVVLVPFARIANIVGVYEDWPAAFDDAAATMMSGVDDDDALTVVWPMDGSIQPVIDLLRSRHKSVFATPLARKLGSRFSDLFHVDNHKLCRGKIRIARLLEEPELKALELTGLIQAAPAIRNLVLVNDKGDISGFGFNRRGAWQGYSRLTGNNKSVSVYGLLPDGSGACSIATFE
ncbi:MAG TPA: hypothetical protein VHZ07_28530 [Bryobacteraceae bacterium]|nr:hypothetical protein [Bryobacteraceae bacterium]